jgi:transposase
LYKTITITSKKEWLWKQKNYAAVLMFHIPSWMFVIKTIWASCFICRYNNQGFAKILEHTGVGYHFVMEATGVYYIRLAFYLHSRGCVLSVVNAMAIKRYIQMHLERNKTDKKDAGWICRYAIEQQPAYWQMPDSAYFESKQLYNTIREYTEQIKRFHNQA